MSLLKALGLASPKTPADLKVPTGLSRGTAAASKAPERLVVNGQASRATRAEDTEKSSPTPPMDFSVPIELPETSLSYVKVKGSVTYVVTINPQDEEADVSVKFKNLSPEAQAGYHAKLKSELAEKYHKEIKVGDEMEVNKKGGSLGFSLDLEDTKTKGQKFTVGFRILEFDGNKHSIEWAAFEVKDTFPLARSEVVVMDMRICYVGHVDVKIVFEPDWKKIGIYILERLGITIVEDGAASVAAGGTGAAGSVAIAAAGSPVIVVTAGIVGGIALAAGTMALIGAWQAQGADASSVCSECARKLFEYAESYGSTMRGVPGKNPDGKQDAEAALLLIMEAAPGTTREQAVDAAKKSGQNFHELAYRQLLPKMREAAKAAYDKLHPNADGVVFQNVLNALLGPDSHYGAAPPMPRSAADVAKTENEAKESGPRFKKAVAIEDEIDAAKKSIARLSEILRRLAMAQPKPAAEKAYNDALTLFEAAEALANTTKSARHWDERSPFDDVVASVLDKGARAKDGYNQSLAMVKKGIALYSVDDVKAAAG